MLPLGESDVGKPPTSPQTYIIAQNPAVLAHLMRENEKRGINPSMYTAPVTVFNTIAVDIDSQTGEAINPNNSSATGMSAEKAEDLPMKTLPLQTKELLKLDPTIEELRHSEMAGTPSMQSLASTATLSEINDISSTSTETLDRYKNPQDAILGTPQERPPPPEYPHPCEIINAQTQQTHSIDPMYKSLQRNQNGGNNNQTGQYDMANQHIPLSTFASPQQQYYQQNYGGGGQMQNPSYLPPYPGQVQSPGDQNAKSRSLERNQTQNIVQAYAARLNSLERTKNSDYSSKVSRSNSLTRQLNSGPEMLPPQSMNSRSASLERGPPMNYGPKSGSLERKQHPPNVAGYNPPIYPGPGQQGGSLERNQSQAMVIEMMNRGFRGGSLERNPQGAYFNVNRSSSLERNMPYQPPYRQAQKKEEPFQEEIYDFGGVNVKSCAAIALKKSVEKGLLPPSALNQLNQQQNPLSPQPQMHQEPHSMPPLYSQQQQQRMWQQQTGTPQRMGMMGLMSPNSYNDPHGFAQAQV